MENDRLGDIYTHYYYLIIFHEKLQVEIELNKITSYLQNTMRFFVFRFTLQTKAGDL